MNNNLQVLIRSCTELGAVSVIEQLGLHSGEMSHRKARDIYGKWFEDAVKDGRLHPCRVEEGEKGRRMFRVVDILNLKVYDASRADLTL